MNTDLNKWEELAMNRSKRGSYLKVALKVSEKIFTDLDKRKLQKEREMKAVSLAI